MPEISDNAAILLATSYQAKNRAELHTGDLRKCNSIVVLIFACFYLEETIEVVIQKLEKSNDVIDFTNRSNPGLLGKFAWFYNNYLFEEPKSSFSYFFEGKVKEILQALDSAFPRFQDLYNFRNDISHGKINKFAMDLSEVCQLRQAAKDIVNELLRITNLEKHRVVKFDSAIKNFSNNYHENK